MIPESELEIRVIDTRPHTGMAHAGTYPKLVRITHVPTNTVVQVGTRKTLVMNKALALDVLEWILE